MDTTYRHDPFFFDVPDAPTDAVFQGTRRRKSSATKSKVSFKRHDGSTVTFKAKPKRKSPARTMAELNARLRKVPPAFRPYAREKWRSARGR